jgi:hypothetical protein
MPKKGILPDVNITIRLNAQLFIASTTAIAPESKTVDDIVRKIDGFYATCVTIQAQQLNITDILILRTRKNYC